MGRNILLKAGGDINEMEGPIKKLANHLGPKFISVTVILSPTQTGSKKYDMSVIELSQNQLLETHLGSSPVVPPTQSQTNPEG